MPHQSVGPHDVLFYRCAFRPGIPAAQMPTGCRAELWRPKGTELVPPGLLNTRFLIWSIFHHLRAFSNRDYALLLVRKNGKIVHRSCIFPRYLRFPFMAAGDIQVGDTWTSADIRGRGLALAGLVEIVRNMGRPGRCIWYLVEDGNAPSIAVATKAGFSLFGRGRRTMRFGIRLFGDFRLEKISP